MRNYVYAGLAVLTLGSGAAVWAQSTTDDHSTMNRDHTMTHAEGMTHDQTAEPEAQGMASGSMPTEPGQGAFAALIEIVEMLRNDPETDWNRVDISGLRGHLVDMDMLITHAEVETKKLRDGLEMTVSLQGLGGGAVSRMVPAHGPFLAGETGWTSTVEVNDTSVTWVVTSLQEAHIIQSLGFFGLITVGNHHQAHHIGMARGEMVHAH